MHDFPYPPSLFLAVRHVPRTSYSPLDTFAVVCIVQLQSTHGEKPNRRNFRVWNSHREAWSRDRGYSGRGIFGGSVLQVYYTPCRTGLVNMIGLVIELL